MNIDKASPLRWMDNANFHGFRIRNSLAFGDNPSGNDRPLTFFTNEGMPFVNVGKEKVELNDVMLQVGGFECGTANTVTHLNVALQECDVVESEIDESASIFFNETVLSQIPKQKRMASTL
jgi:hypothetical protein